MSQNTFVAGIVVAAAVAGAWWYTNQPTAPVDFPLQVQPVPVQQNSNAGSQPAQQPASTGGQSTLSGSLSYTHPDYTDPQMKRFGVAFQYATQPLCDSQTTILKFSVESGDGRTYTADCGGVVEHMYTQAGTYTARYVVDGKELAKTSVVIP